MCPSMRFGTVPRRVLLLPDRPRWLGATGEQPARRLISSSPPPVGPLAPKFSIGRSSLRLPVASPQQPGGSERRLSPVSCLLSVWFLPPSPPDRSLHWRAEREAREIANGKAKANTTRDNEDGTGLRRRRVKTSLPLVRACVSFPVWWPLVATFWRDCASRGDFRSSFSWAARATHSDTRPQARDRRHGDGGRWTRTLCPCRVRRVVRASGGGQPDPIRQKLFGPL